MVDFTLSAGSPTVDIYENFYTTETILVDPSLVGAPSLGTGFLFDPQAIIYADYIYYFVEYGIYPDLISRTDNINLLLPEEWTAEVVQPFTLADFGIDIPGGNLALYYVTLYDGAGEEAVRLEVRGEIQSISNICFTPGTRIMTDQGPRAVEDLRPGDQLLTRDNGHQPLRLNLESRLTAETLRQFPERAPIRIAAGTLGDHGTLEVSPEHRMLVTGWRANALFEAPEVLAAARDLVDGERVVRTAPTADVTYHHLLLDAHELVLAEGAWAESFDPAFLGAQAERSATRDDVLEIFPHLETDLPDAPRAKTLSAAEVATLF